MRIWRRRRVGRSRSSLRHQWRNQFTAGNKAIVRPRPFAALVGITGERFLTAERNQAARCFHRRGRKPRCRTGDHAASAHRRSPPRDHAGQVGACRLDRSVPCWCPSRSRASPEQSRSMRGSAAQVHPARSCESLCVPDAPRRHLQSLEPHPSPCRAVTMSACTTCVTRSPASS